MIIFSIKLNKNTHAPEAIFIYVYDVAMLVSGYTT